MPGAITLHCAFGGILPIYLRTYTTTYAAIAPGWDWSPNSLQPMEFEAYKDATGKQLGFKSRLIDAFTGYTNVNAGNVTGGLLSGDQMVPLVYRPGDARLLGWAVSLWNAQSPAVCSFYAPFDGQTHNYDFKLLPGFTLNAPPPPNTFAPAPGAGCNWLVNGGGIYTSGYIDLAFQTYIWDSQLPTGAGITHKPNTDYGLTFPTNARFGACIPYNGLDYIFISDSTGGAINYNLAFTDFGASQTANVTMENPATSTLDINALFQTANNTLSWNATYLGWLKVFKDTQTFNGQTMVGYAILVAPDFSSYVILNFIPLDNTAANWNQLIGEMSAKVDRTGAMWMKRANNDTALFLGTKVIPGTVLPGPITPILPATLLNATLGLLK